MTPSTCSGDDFRKALLVASDRVCEAREALCALDAVAGDGDLGATLMTGFTYAHQALQERSGDDIGAMLTVVGAQLASKAPSTMGALLATAFLRAGRHLSGVVELSAGHIASLLEVAAAGVTERGGAQPGQRTVLDAMVPAATAARLAATRGVGVDDAVAAARAAAVRGAEQTAEMEPQLGRAGWIKERARGSRDAGATAWATFLEGLHDGLARAITHGVAPAAPAEDAATTARDGAAPVVAGEPTEPSPHQ